MKRVFVVRIAVVYACLLGGQGDVFAQRLTENVVLVTLDGVRHQEIFGGLDRDLTGEAKDAEIKSNDLMQNPSGVSNTWRSR